MAGRLEPEGLAEVAWERFGAGIEQKTQRESSPSP